MSAALMATDGGGIKHVPKRAAKPVAPRVNKPAAVEARPAAPEVNKPAAAAAKKAAAIAQDEIEIPEDIEVLMRG
jgi:hypothetical protein